jgi:hypothetical protein
MATVHYRRSSITHLLRERLSGRFFVVPSPNHPLLMRGPDIIVSTERLITALFTPSARERKSRSLLKSRFALSRLALPPHTRFLLVVESGDESLAQTFTSDFAEIVEWSNRGRLARIIEDRNFLGRHRDVPPGIAGDAQVRFANAMTVMRLSARLSRRPFSAAFGEEVPVETSSPRAVSGIRPGSRRPSISRETELEGVAVSELSDARIDVRLVHNLVDEQTVYVFSLDNGIPHSRPESAGIAIINDWPFGSRDPDKLIHAAAFAGWAFVLEQNRHELPRFAERLRDKQAQ